MQLAKGTLLHGGTYRIIDVLGQGSFGITYLAEHTSLGKKICIKEFFMKELNSRSDDGSITGLSDGSLSYNYAQKFRKEAQNLACMEHPNIVRVTDSFDENGTFYYVMDYIDGCNLNDYVKKYKVSEKIAVEIIRSTANALIYMHEDKHMLHLDLKPGNIMRRASDGHIFLIDFGLSKHYDNNGAPETSTTIGLGTAGYAPIEQSNQAKNGEFRPTIDVYALGATLYKLLTRETPPAASELVSDDELVKDSLQQHGVSDKLSSVIVKAMMPNVRKRIQTIRQFMEMLPAGSSSIPEQSITSVESEDEGTIIVNAKDEETELVNVAPKPQPHPDFTEESYHIDSKYSKFPTSTKQKAESGDLDAAIAYGMMALRGQGVSQDIDEAYEWFVFAYKKGDDRGVNMINQWSALKSKYNSSDKGRDDKSKPKTMNTHSSKNTKTNKILIGVVVGIIAIVGVMLGMNLNGYNSDNTNESHVSYSNGVLNVDGITYEMVKVQAGTFIMGATSGIAVADEMEKPAHKVTLTNDYYIGRTEVTQALWKAVMGNNPSEFKGDNLPVENVSWNDCYQFISKLNSITGQNFRLPTEAEWEFAARGGNNSKHFEYSGGNKIGDVAWLGENSGGKTHDVATKQPNELGIYDMTGNVMEWCADWFDYYKSNSQTNPLGPQSGTYRILRGWTWHSEAKNCAIASRDAFKPEQKEWDKGLRLALSE